MIKRFNMKSVILVATLTLVATTGASSKVFATGESLKEIFTDVDFRWCVVESFQSKVDSSITEDSVLTDTQMADLDSLTCNNKSLTEVKLAGLEQLVGLTSLSLSTNQLADIDLTNNVALERLTLANNELTNLDLSKNTDLAYLDVRGNADLDLDNLDISTTKLNTLTNDDGVWEYVETDNEDDEVTDKGNDVVTNDNTHNNEMKPCESWNIDDETITIFKGMLAAYGYDTSRYDIAAVRLAAAQTNMCDGMNMNEARSLMNAMGVTDLSDAELTEIAAMVTRAYNAIADGATLEELLTVARGDGGLLVPNTGVSTGDFNANVVVISLGAVMIVAGIFYAVRYGMKRKEATVTFRR